MRTIFCINIVTNHHLSQYSIDHMKDALEDLEGNGYSAIDIKFDFNGDIIILAMPMI